MAHSLGTLEVVSSSYRGRRPAPHCLREFLAVGQTAKPLIRAARDVRLVSRKGESAFVSAI